ncbi:MAG TPA: UDP-N-acetylglucosamine 1-carboxyvinyltransferase [Haloplasmataceae bacterium]
MKKIIINGGVKLSGIVDIDGSKNSIVALIPASILCRDRVRIYNYPKISDVLVLCDILKELNVSVLLTDNYIEIDSSNIKYTSLINEKMEKLRASYYFMGVLLALFNEVEITYPGGCNFGPRPIDLHLEGFKALNCEVRGENDILFIKSPKLIGNRIKLDFASVGATINLMFASIFIEGYTIIENAAKEPEIVDIAHFLNKMGAKIEGAGSESIKITGVKRLKGTEHTVIPDRIEAGTYLLIASAIGEEIELRNVYPSHLHTVLKTLEVIGVNIIKEKYSLLVNKVDKIFPINITTAVYPGFPTDLQQIITSLMTQAEGTSFITEKIYSSRFRNCEELIKMGANIIIKHPTAIINGPTPLKGTIVEASDLRGGASLILAGLIAENQTIINKAEHIFRGYGNIINKLTNIGAKLSVEES